MVLFQLLRSDVDLMGNCQRYIQFHPFADGR